MFTFASVSLAKVNVSNTVISGLDHSYLFLRCDRMTEEEVSDSRKYTALCVCVHVVLYSNTPIFCY